MINIEEILIWVFHHLYHEDCANACMHTAPVRYSPLTFRVAEAIAIVRQGNGDTPVSPTVLPEVFSVLADLGAYEEDRGR